MFEKDMDIQSMMSLKRESTLQNIKQQQSIKDASMYVGTIYCLLPDGTEPEVQHLFLLHHPVTLTITCPTLSTDAIPRLGPAGVSHVWCASRSRPNSKLCAYSQVCLELWAERVLSCWVERYVRENSRARKRETTQQN